jgi:NADPH:quinone reductase-like Zn-dependent oxidoreductase
VATTTSAANVELVEGLGADIVIDYETQDFEAILDNYDVVLHRPDATALQKSLRVLKPGGRLISISGPPDPALEATSLNPGSSSRSCAPPARRPAEARNASRSTTRSSSCGRTERN